MARNHDIKIKLSFDEHCQIKNKADSMGLSMNAFCRLILLNVNLERYKLTLEKSVSNE